VNALNTQSQRVKFTTCGGSRAPNSVGGIWLPRALAAALYPGELPGRARDAHPTRRLDISLQPFVDGRPWGPRIDSHVIKGHKVTAGLAGLRGLVGWRIAGFRRAGGPAALDLIIERGDGQQDGEGAVEEGSKGANEGPVSDEEGSGGEDGRERGWEDDWEEAEAAEEEQGGGSRGGGDVSNRGAREGDLFTLPTVRRPRVTHAGSQPLAAYQSSQPVPWQGIGLPHATQEAGRRGCSVGLTVVRARHPCEPSHPRRRRIRSRRHWDSGRIGAAA
jgi:hypothetical protein